MVVVEGCMVAAAAQGGRRKNSAALIVKAMDVMVAAEMGGMAEFA
jgi:hypothetical protein